MKQTDIIKVGTNSMVEEDSHGQFGWRDLAIDSLVLQAADSNAVIVSSAAITAGMMSINLKERPPKEEITELQRLSSLGWHHVLNRWERAMPVGRRIGGMLLTRQELVNPRSAQEAMDVMQSIISNGDVPVINENDAISHEEISFGDNDILAAILAVAQKKSGQFGEVRLFLASDVNGICIDPDDPDTRIPVITDTSKYEHLAQEAGSKNGSGGPRSKLMAADIVNEEGIDMWVYDGTTGVHRDLAVEGVVGTHFPAHS